MITVHWDNVEQTTIRCDYAEPITWEEYDAAVDQVAAMLQSASQPVWVLHNPGAAKMPPGSPIPHVRAALQKNKHPNCRMVIAVINDIFALNMVTTVVRVLFRGRFRVAGSLNEAYQVIHEEHWAKI